MHMYIHMCTTTLCHCTCMHTQEGSKKFAELSGKLGGNIKKQVKQVGDFYSCFAMLWISTNIHNRQG